MLRPGRLKDDVEAGIDRIRCGRRGTRLGVMQHRRATRRRRIGDDETLESPIAFELSIEQRATLRRGRSIDGVVRGHDRPRASLGYGVAERWVEQLFERPLVEVD